VQLKKFRNMFNFEDSQILATYLDELTEALLKLYNVYQSTLSNDVSRRRDRESLGNLPNRDGDCIRCCLFLTNSAFEEAHSAAHTKAVNHLLSVPTYLEWTSGMMSKMLLKKW